MTASSYTVSGNGPGGATFSQTTTGTTVTVNNLAVGSWTVTVQAYNTASTLIGSGTVGPATVSASASTPVTVSVTPIAGTGTLGLTVSWSSATSLTAPSIVATLSPALGSTLSGWTGLAAGTTGTGTYSNSSVATGYSTLILSLLDGTLTKASVVDVARIVNGQTTTGSYSFTNLNTAGGSIPVTISSNMQNPLTVTVAGSGYTTVASVAANSYTTIPLSSSETLTAAATGNTGTGTMTYVWYKDGANVGTGTSYAYTAAKPSGYSGTYYCNIAVVAITSDGTQAGVLNFYTTVN